MNTTWISQKKLKLYFNFWNSRCLLHESFWKGGPLLTYSALKLKLMRKYIYHFIFIIMLLFAASVSQKQKRDLLVFFCDLTKQMENVINWNLKGNFWKHTTSRATGPLCYVTFKWNWKTTLWAGGHASQLLAYFDIPVFALWSTLILVLLAPNMSQTLNAKFIF